jgi:hypothetical protein
LIIHTSFYGKYHLLERFSGRKSFFFDVALLFPKNGKNSVTKMSSYYNPYCEKTIGQTKLKIL